MSQEQKEKELTKIQGNVYAKQRQLDKLIKHEMELKEKHLLAASALAKAEQEMRELDEQFTRLLQEVAEARTDDKKATEMEEENQPDQGAKEKAQWMKQGRRGKATEDQSMNGDTAPQTRGNPPDSESGEAKRQKKQQAEEAAAASALAAVGSASGQEQQKK